MTIPKNINREHIIKAIQKIDRDGVPERRESTRYNLSYGDKYYPPKYVISISNIFANDIEHPSPKFNGGEETNSFLSKLGFTIVDTLTNSNETSDESTLFSIPVLDPVNRSREYQIYDNSIRDRIVYEYLFHSRTHRWLDEHIIGLNPDESRGYQAMGILHFIGLKDKHKGIFKDLGIQEAIQLLEMQDFDLSLVIQSLQRYQQQDRGDRDVEEGSSVSEYIELESIVIAASEQIEVSETEKEQVIKSRIGQSTFKKALLDIEKKCRLCGVTDERFLIASHIKPWSQSNNQERLEVNNGLLLCPNHDSVFDKGYISFADDGLILISDSLDEATKVFLNINEIMNIRVNESQRQYMKWHRENLFKN
ncbi:HNH endonuclease [Peribacillus asahii]|uniref:HNH endonuclease n=1 Tax=Peribacillus asahii TaxID=228899 RepID=UPI00381700E2